MCLSFLELSRHFTDTVMRSQAWDVLSKEGRIQPQLNLENKSHKRRDDLLQSFKFVNLSSWQKKIAMYLDIIEAICQGLYKGDNTIFVVDAHLKGTFHSDISVAHSDDSCLPYCIQYFLDLKLLKGKIDTAENCGHILDYLNAVHGYQPYMMEFIGILSNVN